MPGQPAAVAEARSRAVGAGSMLSGSELSPRPKNPSDFGLASRDTYSFGGHPIDISRRSLTRLTRIVDKVMFAAKWDAWVEIQAEEPEVAQRLVSNVYRDRQIQRILRTHALPVK